MYPINLTNIYPLQNYKQSLNTCRTNVPNDKNSLRFKGHVGVEELKVLKDKQLLIQETKLFREYETLKKICSCLSDFPKHPRIVVGACSTGEEAFSLNMLTQNLNPEIIGFDIGKRAIQQAQTSTVILAKPKAAKDEHMVNLCRIKAYDDNFLGFDKKNLTKIEQEQKDLFNASFEEVELPKKTFREKLKDYLDKTLFSDYIVELDKKAFKIKEEKNNCLFFEGNILNTDKIISNNSVSCFTFRNALYHILTTNISGTHRYHLNEQKGEALMTRIAENVNKALCKNGIFVLGETEHKQGTNMDLVCNTLKKTGFIEHPDNTNKIYCNIWKKVEDV